MVVRCSHGESLSAAPGTAATPSVEQHKETTMCIYHVVDYQNRNYGSYTSRERAMRLAESLQAWFADRTYFVEEVHYALD